MRISSDLLQSVGLILQIGGKYEQKKQNKKQDKSECKD